MEENIVFGGIRTYLCELTHELELLGQSVDTIIVSDEWHDRLNLEARTPLDRVDKFYGSRYLVAKDIESPYYLLIKPLLKEGESYVAKQR